MSVTAASKECSVPRRTLYYWRSEDQSFKDAWDDAIAASVEELEDHLRKRATDPSDKNAHILLMFLLKKLDPSYRENYKAPEKSTAVKAQEFEFTSEELDLALGILEVAKAAKPGIKD
jgi:AcrR family transcriptional regulator